MIAGVPLAGCAPFMTSSAHFGGQFAFSSWPGLSGLPIAALLPGGVARTSRPLSVGEASARQI